MSASAKTGSSKAVIKRWLADFASLIADAICFIRNEQRTSKMTTELMHALQLYKENALSRVLAKDECQFDLDFLLRALKQGSIFCFCQSTGNLFIRDEDGTLTWPNENFVIKMPGITQNTEFRIFMGTLSCMSNMRFESVPSEDQRVITYQCFARV